MPVPLATVSELWRYPVKSMGGESREELPVEHRGVVGDRLWAVVDPEGRLGSGKDSRRFRRIDGLLDCRAALDADVPVITLPDGGRVRADDAEAAHVLGEVLHRDDLGLAVEASVPHHDAGPLHIVTLASVAAVRTVVDDATVDVARFRPNVVIDTGHDAGYVENAWVGRRLRIGEVVVEVTEGTERCVMVNASQPGLTRSHQVLRRISSGNGLALGVYATVVRPGVLRRGATVTFL